MNDGCFGHFVMILWAIAFFCPVPHWFAIGASAFPFVVCMLIKWNNYFHDRY